jgi:hypothetical protein
MRRRNASFLGLLAAAAFVVSCSNDAGRGTSPTAPGQPRFSTTVAACGATLSSLTSMVNTVFGAGSPNASSALGKLDNLDKQLQKGNLSGAQDQARNIVSFIQLKAQQGGLPGTPAQIQLLISSVLCYAGLSPDTFLIYPSDAAQVIKHSAGSSAISFQGNTVNEPTLITIEVLPETTPPLITKLDQYPGYIKITQSSPLTKPAIVGVCPSASVPTEVLGRLRLGHQASTGFAITPAADPGFLDCSTSTAQTKSPGLLQRLAGIFTPKPLYAKTTIFGGGIAGTVTEFSPFAPVDVELTMRGGIAGTVTEFRAVPTDSIASPTPRPTLPRKPGEVELLRTPGGRVNTVVNGVCTQIDAIVGTPVETECRPVVTLETFQGTLLQNVPVSWVIGQGGGVIAPEATLAHTCGAFGSTASTATNAAGNASVCWTLGATAGTNTVLATASAGGDAPAGVTFSPAGFTFTATATKITPTATATGGVFVYNGSARAGSGTCSHGLTPVLSYSSGTAPVNAGTYTLTVTCGAGNPTYNTVTQTATIQITPAPTIAAVSCPVSMQYTGSALTPCTGSVTGPGLSLTIIPTYTSNVVGTATATVSYAGGGNYLPSTASKTFQISYVQVGCFSSPIYNVMPSTKSFQNKGSNVPVKCTLATAQGTGVSNATGSLLVQDMGTDGLGTPVTVFSLANAFKATTSGNYSYGLDTSPSGFVSRHYYQVTATWSDGSKTIGWFYIK